MLAHFTTNILSTKCFYTVYYWKSEAANEGVLVKKYSENYGSSDWSCFGKRMFLKIISESCQAKLPCKIPE